MWSQSQKVGHSLPLTLPTSPVTLLTNTATTGDISPTSSPEHRQQTGRGSFDRVPPRVNRWRSPNPPQPYVPSPTPRRRDNSDNAPPHLSNPHWYRYQDHCCLHPKNCWHCCCYRETYWTGYRSVCPSPSTSSWYCCCYRDTYWNGQKSVCLSRYFTSPPPLPPVACQCFVQISLHSDQMGCYYVIISVQYSLPSPTSHFTPFPLPLSFLLSLLSLSLSPSSSPPCRERYSHSWHSLRGSGPLRLLLVLLFWILCGLCVGCGYCCVYCCIACAYLCCDIDDD